ncbi:ectoine/hydroxyectoine ABC transporter permease subunit EhuD [Salinibacillus aidingensis]|uniref:Ectoine/hydroxyectoine ABC transporter permease subunit EhuD n=1 Tax=Salinibacillus aidingensis TaxID=237684 RepID=A0ABP3KVJ1_9BACI
MTWSWNYVWESLPLIFEGMWITLGLTIGCFAFAMLFGFVWTFLRRIPWTSVQKLVGFLLEFIRSTPPLVQLFFLFYAWPMVPYVGVTLDPISCAILGLGGHFSTYISEIYRSGIESVDKGQWEAAKALNLSTGKKWTKIILPQAIPPTIPMLGNYLIIMFKEVPLTATIGVTGMLHAAESFGAQTFAYVEPLTLVALFFLAMSYPSAVLIRKLEKKFNRRFDKKNPTGTNNNMDKGVAVNG